MKSWCGVEYAGLEIITLCDPDPQQANWDDSEGLDVLIGEIPRVIATAWLGWYIFASASYKGVEISVYGPM
jgi:hypothetical protein